MIPLLASLTLPDWLPELTSIVGIVLGVLSSLFSAFFSNIARRSEDRKQPKRIFAANSADPGVTDIDRIGADTRLTDARNELIRQEASAKWNGRSATSLAVSQYVVGGTLATSFIQSTLPESAIGFLGLVVLLSSIIYQRFRPDLRMSAARRRVAVMKAVIRRAEDGLYAIRESLPNAPTYQAIRNEVTNALIQVEHSELEENFLPIPAPVDKPKTID